MLKKCIKFLISISGFSIDLNTYFYHKNKYRRTDGLKDRLFRSKRSILSIRHHGKDNIENLGKIYLYCTHFGQMSRQII